MAMRDLLILTIVGLLGLVALRKPWIGVMLWTWLSILNPHRYSFGITYDMPVAAAAAICTFVGFLMTSDERSSPFKSAAVVALAMFMVWMTLSWFNGLDTTNDYDQWIKVMKIDGMVVVALMLLHTKRHVLALAWVSVGSLLLLGVKGGIFTVISGGNERVWGPPGTFIEDNNEFGLALIMAIPIMRFMQQQLKSTWARYGMTVAMLLCAAAALGTQSRGALLAITAMGLMFWWRGKNRLINSVMIGLVAVSLVGFMPESWTARMNTIETYELDTSAQGRLAAWSAAWNMSFDYPTGVGFNTVRQELFDRYSHNPAAGARAAHSIYFQALGNHGFVGLVLFMAIWVITWRQAGWLRKVADKSPHAKWCADLGAMAQVSLMGYFVGGAFLSLSYFDLPYVIMVMVVVARTWVLKKAWEREAKVSVPVPAEMRRPLGGLPQV